LADDFRRERFVLQLDPVAHVPDADQRHEADGYMRLDSSRCPVVDWTYFQIVLA
jgi:hypothetical protein